ncbi:MAG: OPT/YSL family transporter [Polyangiaceae bacterium]|nr:OPT/YSL family transporter [Polyangiaceae bacterium]
MSSTNETSAKGFLPPVGTWKFHLLLSLVAIFVLGPLGGIAAAYMNFSLGFFVGGQVLAGILGSAVTYGYGASGKHGANYMQTMAASVASMAGMGVLVQAMVWLGMPQPPAWQLMIFFCCIGMFGVGIGMLYTPVLVDRLKLTYPSGWAVANILRALTDKALLKRSIGQLGGGTGLGIAGAYLAEHVKAVAALGLSVSTVGAGIVVASRIAVPGLVGGVLGHLVTPALRDAGWLGEKDPFRKIGFLIGLAMILGAAVVDLAIIAWQALKRVRQAAAEAGAADEYAEVAAREGQGTQRPLGVKPLAAWVVFWGLGVVGVGALVLGQPVGFLSFAIALSLVFVLINGISTGISDSNPISSAFVICVFLMSALGLKDPITGIIAASVLLVACAVGVDMQQDRSTGARLGTNRDIQFRYQVVGILMGSVLAVVLANTFMKAYPVLTINSFDRPEADVGQWQSAMTFKFVGAIRGLGHLEGYKLAALGIGLGFGFVTEVARKLLRASARYRAFLASGRGGFVTGWLLDAVLLSSPYALSFGGFVDLGTTAWFAAGGCFTSLVQTWQASRPKREQDSQVPEDMSATSLVGGGLIAGESLYALAVGVMGLLALAR